MKKKKVNNGSDANSGKVPKQKERHIVSWSQEEDDILREQIRLHGTENWAIIASKFKDKTTRQCRRRWFTYLNSDFKKGGWSPEEDMLLCEAQKIFGNRWTEIVKVVSGRFHWTVNFVLMPKTQKTPTLRCFDGIQVMTRAQTKHPLDPLSATEISVAVATVRAAGATPEVRDSMRFVEVVLLEPEKHVVALVDAYFFPPFQPSLLARTKGGPAIPSKLAPRQARLVVYNKKSNETSLWIVELTEVHATTRGGHHRGKVVSSSIVPDVQPPMDATEYAECEAVVKDHPPFIEAMKKRGIHDMDLVMVDPWCVGCHSEADAPVVDLQNHSYFAGQRVTAHWKMVMHGLLKEFMCLLICKIWW